MQMKTNDLKNYYIIIKPYLLVSYVGEKKQQ